MYNNDTVCVKINGWFTTNNGVPGKSIVETYIRIKIDMMVKQVGRFIYLGNGTN
jgi:hypothetical protein